MEQREKLIELLLNNPRADGCYGAMCDVDCKYFESDHCYTEMLTDYLLANGVVVLPCRCCECDYHDHDGGAGYCNYWNIWSNMSDYCNHAKRKGGDE